MVVITFSEAVNLKKYIWEHYKVNLHIHDTCGGGLYFSLDEPAQEVSDFLSAYFKTRGIKTLISQDGKTMYFDDSYTEKQVDISVIYESNRQRTAAYDGEDLIGECTYLVKNRTWIIDHTYVRSIYRNQNIAKRLVLLLVDEAKKAHVTVIPECSYAKKVLG